MTHVRLTGPARAERPRWLGVVLLLLLPAYGPAARAHEGPPFPILVDQTVGPYLVSVWTDPDIGTGTFFVVVESLPDRALPPLTSVEVAVAPSSGRLEEVRYRAEPQRVRYGARYYAEVAFDRGELWQVRILLDGPEGGGELRAEVEATPDGTIGPIGLLVYFIPFLLVGLLWLKAMLRQRERRRADPPVGEQQAS